MKLRFTLFLYCFYIGLLGFIISGCGPSDFDLRVEATKKTYRPEVVRSATVPLFERAKIRELDYVTNFPKVILSLPIFQGASPQDIEVYEEGTNTLVFMVGRVYGHCGVLVSKNTSDKDIHSTSSRLVKFWGSGVYFFLSD